MLNMLFSFLWEANDSQEVCLFLLDAQKGKTGLEDGQMNLDLLFKKNWVALSTSQDTLLE